MNPYVTAWLFDAGIAAGIALLLLSAAFGVALLLVPQRTLRVAGTLSRQFSARQALRPLEIPRPTEPFIYRRHRLVGLLLLAGVMTFYLLYLFDFPRESVIAQLAASTGAPLAEVFLDALIAFFVFANALIAILAIAMVIRPSALKPIEAIANRWLSTRKLLRPIETGHAPLDRWASHRPRLLGVLILVGTAYIAAGWVVALQ